MCRGRRKYQIYAVKNSPNLFFFSYSTSTILNTLISTFFSQRNKQASNIFFCRSSADSLIFVLFSSDPITRVLSSVYDIFFLFSLRVLVAMRLGGYDTTAAFSHKLRFLVLASATTTKAHITQPTQINELSLTPFIQNHFIDCKIHDAKKQIPLPRSTELSTCNGIALAQCDGERDCWECVDVHILSREFNESP